MLSSRKYPHFPHRRDWNFLGGRGFWKTKKFKEMYEAQSEFPEGWGDLEKFPSVGEVWIFSGPTQYKIIKSITCITQNCYINQILTVPTTRRSSDDAIVYT